VFTPLFNKIPLKAVVLATAILDIIFVNQIPLFYFWGIVHYSFYFYVGIYFNSIYENYAAFKHKKFLVMVTFILLALINLKDVSARLYPIYNLITALTGIILFINISYLLINNKLGEIFKFIGNYSYDIYLFSWFFQTGARVILFQMLKLNYNFVILMMLIVGFLPIILSKFILNKVFILDRIFLGNTRMQRVGGKYE
jgi:peptidoglycan/LPS O-acetylase OafA/YrhL